VSRGGRWFAVACGVALAGAFGAKAIDAPMIAALPFFVAALAAFAQAFSEWWPL
jgi:hypothetical protein